MLQIINHYSKNHEQKISNLFVNLSNIAKYIFFVYNVPKIVFFQIEISKIEHFGTRAGSTTAQWQNVITPKPNVCHLPHCYSYDTNGFSTHWSCVRYYSLLMVSGIQTHCICNLTGYRGWLSDQINYQSMSSLLCICIWFVNFGKDQSYFVQCTACCS